MDVRVSVESTGDVSSDINIEIPRAVYDQQYNSVLARTASQARLKGFRPGKVPRAVIAKMHGQAIHADVVQKLVDEAFRDAIKDHSLKVVGQPAIDLPEVEPEQDLKVTAKVSLLPEPELKDYFGIECEAEQRTTTKKDKEAHLQEFCEQHAERVEVTDRKVVEKSDIVAVAFRGLIDGEPFAGSESEDGLFEVGGGHAPEDFENALIGAEIDVEKSATVKMPDDIADQEVAGKEAEYVFTVKKIETKLVPEFDEALVEKTKIAETVEEAKEKILENFESDVERSNKGAKENAVCKAIAEQNTFEIPQVMIDEEIRQMLFEAGMLDQKDERSYQIDVSGFREQVGENAEFRVRRAIVIERIVEQEGIEATEDDVSQWLDQQAAESGTDREMLDRIYGFPKEISRLQDMVARQKTIDLLVEKAQITTKKSKK